MTITVQLAYLGTAAAVAIGAAVQDLRTKKIPDWLTGSGFVIGFLMHLILGGFVQVAGAVLAGLVSGLLFLVLYLAGGMGLSDVKLIAATGCIVGISSIKDVLLASVFLGSILSLALAAKHGMVRKTIRNVFILLAHHTEHGLVAHPELNGSSPEALRLPFALPIALGCTTAFCIGSIAGVAQ